MNLMGDSKASELIFQNDMIKQLVANGWLLGKAENYNRELALYPEDLLGFVQETQDAQWQKFCVLYPNNPEEKFLERVANQLYGTRPQTENCRSGRGTQRYDVDGRAEQEYSRL